MTAQERIMQQLLDQQKEDAAKEAKKSNRGNTEFSFLNFDLGETKIFRLLPPIQGFDVADGWRLFDFHYGAGPSGKERFTCPESYAVREGEVARTCKKCTEAKGYMMSSDKSTKEKGYQIKQKTRAVFQGIERGHDDDGPKLFECSYTTFKVIRKILLKPYVGLKLFGVEEGFDLEITRSATKQDINPFTIELVLVETDKGAQCEPTPLSADAAKVKLWMSKRYDLTRYMAFEFSEEQMEQILAGASPKEIKKATFEANKEARAEKERTDPAGDSGQKRSKV